MWDFLFGKNKGQYDAEYDKAIKDTKQARAESAYQNRYNKALYDANKDYFDKVGVKDPSASYWNDNGQKTNVLIDTNNQYNKYISQLEDERAEVAEKNKYNNFGDGILPSILGLNAWNQYLDMVGDFGDVLQKSGKNVMSGDYSVDPTAEWEKRDHLSDLGATVEAGVSLVPLVSTGVGAGAGAIKSATKSLGKSMLKGAASGAAYNGISNLGSYLQQNGRDSSVGGALGSTALGAAIGGTVGAAGAGLGYGLGKAWNKYSPATETKTETITTMGDATPYQEALDKLKSNATGARYSNVATNLPTTQGPDLARITLNNLDDDTLKTLYRSASRNTHPDKVGDAVGDSLFKSVNESNTLLQDFLENGVPTTTTTSTTAVPIGKLQRLKTFASNIPNMGKDLANTKLGTNVANLLKTKRGKLLFGGSAGLTLAGLMKNRNDNNSGQLSDEEMQELYNYVYGGGQ